MPCKAAANGSIESDLLTNVRGACRKDAAFPDGITRSPANIVLCCRSNASPGDNALTSPRFKGLSYSMKTLTAIREAMTYVKETLLYDNKTLTLIIEAMTYVRETSSYDMKTLTVIREALTYVKETLLYDIKTLTVVREALTYVRETLLYDKIDRIGQWIALKQ